MQVIGRRDGKRGSRMNEINSLLADNWLIYLRSHWVVQCVHQCSHRVALVGWLGFSEYSAIFSNRLEFDLGKLFLSFLSILLPASKYSIPGLSCFVVLQKERTGLKFFRKSVEWDHYNYSFSWTSMNLTSNVCLFE